MTIDDKQKLAMMLIDAQRPFANSYSLCKVLAWTFNIINCSEIIEQLIKEEKIIRKKLNENTGREFFVTDKGVEVLVDKTVMLKTLKEEYPNQIPFIEKMLEN